MTLTRSLRHAAFRSDARKIASSNTSEVANVTAGCLRLSAQEIAGFALTDAIPARALVSRARHAFHIGSQQGSHVDV